VQVNVTIFAISFDNFA